MRAMVVGGIDWLDRKRYSLLSQKLQLRFVVFPGFTTGSTPKRTSLNPIRDRLSGVPSPLSRLRKGSFMANFAATITAVKGALTMASLDEEGTDEDGKKPEGDDEEEPEPLVPEIAIMKNVLRFFQLLCENHNREMQVCSVWAFVVFYHRNCSELLAEFLASPGSQEQLQYCNADTELPGLYLW